MDRSQLLRGALDAAALAVVAERDGNTANSSTPATASTTWAARSTRRRPVGCTNTISLQLQVRSRAPSCRNRDWERGERVVAINL
jgi:hypothetical protein